jgi:hypothetical protein
MNSCNTALIPSKSVASCTDSEIYSGRKTSIGSVGEGATLTYAGSNPWYSTPDHNFHHCSSVSFQV